MIVDDIAAIGSKYTIPNNLSSGVDFLNAPVSDASKVENITKLTNTNNNMNLSELYSFDAIVSPIKMINNIITDANSGFKTKFSEGFL
jgi:hypothetical protein